MESIATGVSNLLASLDVDATRELRIALNNQRFKDAVMGAWADNPDAALYVLAHTNSLYVEKDTAPRKGRDKDRDHVVLGVYLDDSLARSEINARRELLRLTLAQQGMHIDEVRDHIAAFDMKDRHLYPDALERLADLFGAPKPGGSLRERPNARPSNGASADQSELLETLKRAFCLSFQSLEHAWAMLEKIEGAALTEVSFSKNASHSTQRYRCHLYVAEGDVEGMSAIIGRSGETIISRARPLGLPIREIAVHRSPETLSGRKAFPRSGRPEALKDLDLHELRSESARIAAEVRRKVRDGR